VWNDVNLERVAPYLLMNPEQIQEITRLRSLNLSPKQIARNLKLRPTEVTAILRQQAAQLDQDRAERGEAAPLYNCIVNKSVAKILATNAPNFNGNVNRFAQVFIARIDRDKLTVCSYLVDYWCLGVKNALGPKKTDRLKYESTVESTSQSFGEDFEEITLAQAQSIVFGAVEYSTGLGFDPHPDFAQALPHLGLRSEPQIPIEFGKNGKPYYINGPYDNLDRIVATLDRSVGKGNYNYTIGSGGF
jgi:hypothetical protein